MYDKIRKAASFAASHVLQDICTSRQSTSGTDLVDFILSFEKLKILTSCFHISLCISATFILLIAECTTLFKNITFFTYLLPVRAGFVVLN